MKALKPLLPDLARHDIRSDFAFLDRLSGLIGRLGIEFSAMKEIAVLKATLVMRASPVAGKGWGKKAVAAADSATPAPDRRFYSLAPSLQLILVSLCLGLAGFTFQDPVAMLAVCFLPGFVMQFMDTLALVPLLVLDTRDATVLAVLPVGGRTIAAAKTLILVSRLLQSAVAMYGLALLPFLFKGLWVVVPGYLLAVVLSCLLSTVLAYLVYGLVLRYADGQKLKDLISTFQIMMSVLVIVGYQLISRLTIFIDVKASPVFAWWQLAVPPMDLVWVAGLGLGGAGIMPGLAALGVILALLALHFLVSGRLLEENLLKLLGEGEKPRRVYRARVAFYALLGRLFLRDSRERALWQMAYSLSANDRLLKQVLYPSIVAFLIFPAIFLFAFLPKAQAVSLGWIAANCGWLVYTLYFGVITAQAAGRMVMKSEQPKGAALFDGLPLDSPARARRACGLNLIWRFGFLPLAGLGLVMAMLLGPSFLPDVVLALAATVLGGLVGLIHLPARLWPFSLAITAELEGSGRSIGRLLAFVGPLALAHVLVRLWLGPWAVLALLAPAAILTVLVWRRLGRD